MVEHTLDAMALRGLHDHLQGGFYRYCVDRAWTMPHFEKMLYDQAMLLWEYAAAYKVLGKEHYKEIVQKIIVSLGTFGDDLYVSSHDADTDHHEGQTYLWSEDEITQALTEEERKQFYNVYLIVEGHLLKKKPIYLELEKKLLAIRIKRAQPFVDKKIITSWNAILGVGLVIASRYTGAGLEKAETLFKRLLEKHYKDGRLCHSSLHHVQSEAFLEDYASVLLLATYLYEETGKHRDIIEELAKKLLVYKKDEWMEITQDDFRSVRADTRDHPTPSAVSLAEMALLRKKILFDEPYEPLAYKGGLDHDFYNLAASISEGNWHIIHSPEKIDWKKLPLNCIQVRSKQIQGCYAMRCEIFESTEELLKTVNKK